MSFDSFLAAEPYSLPQAEKEALLLAELNELTRSHERACPAYGKVLRALGVAGKPAERLVDVPYLPVSLFKTHKLASIADANVHTVLTSSGTTGQQVSRIYLDATTADLQARALASVITHVVGKQRLPMLIIDTKAVMRDPSLLSARGAGVLGMMRFGRNHCFALDEEMRVDLPQIEGFLAKFGNQNFLIFGFTFMVWAYFYAPLARQYIDLSRGILIHSGGWKKLVEQAVDNDQFKASFAQTTGLRRIYNFYGMVEQIGSVFLEGEDGYLYPPNFADVTVRDPDTWAEASPGRVGVLQVLSALPRSYPGHSLLTEDLGVVEHIDNPESCGRFGKAVRIIGRVPKAELRGCSDVHAFDRDQR